MSPAVDVIVVSSGQKVSKRQDLEILYLGFKNMKFAQKTIKLRGHHLICLHFFRGEGYNLKFIKNLEKILKRVKTGAKIEVCSGADEVCKMCPYLKGEICFYDENAGSEIKKMDIMAIELLRVKNHDRIRWVDIKKKIPDVFSQWSKKYCRECDWRKVCEAKDETLEDKF